MAFKKKANLDVETVFKLGGVDKNGKPQPKQIEGFYVGSRTTETEMGPSTIHVFQTSKGQQGIWGSKTLNTTLSANDVGYMIRVTYTGKKKLSKGKTQHTYDIEIDEEQQSTVLLASSEAEGNDDDGNEVDYEDSEAEDINSENDEEPAPVLAASSAAERKAKVQALVNKRKQA